VKKDKFDIIVKPVKRKSKSKKRVKSSVMSKQSFISSRKPTGMKSMRRNNSYMDQDFFMNSVRSIGSQGHYPYPVTVRSKRNPNLILTNPVDPYDDHNNQCNNMRPSHHYSHMKQHFTLNNSVTGPTSFYHLLNPLQSKRSSSRVSRRSLKPIKTEKRLVKTQFEEDQVSIERKLKIVENISLLHKESIF
jgi:hypothetical protein